MESIEYKYVTNSFFKHDIYTFPMEVGDLIKIQYAAQRGVSSEQGAVQRILNKKRISKIRDFILEGNSFVNTFILNWTNTENLPETREDKLYILLKDRSAQILDGQHRVAGLEEAVKIKPEISKTKVLVSLCIGLETQDAAKIFLNINSEQKPVPKSLVYDLFGEAIDDKERDVIRVTDIISFLNDTEDSPYFKLVKYPGSPRASGMIDLAIMVNAMKQHFEKGGTFDTLNLTEIETQQKIILNFYSVIKDIYNRNGNIWNKKIENPFLKAAGFSGAFDFLTGTLLSTCKHDRKFSKDHMEKLMKLDNDKLIKASDIKSLDGKTARKRIKQFFQKSYLRDSSSSSEEYEF